LDNNNTYHEDEVSWELWFKAMANELPLNSFFFFVVLGFELSAYTLSHSISPFM
jgi:hypothetical protein